MSDIEKIRPYEQYSDVELAEGVELAADLQLRLANVSPDAVIETLISHGCPRRSAIVQVRDPNMRLSAARFYLDCQDQLLGDREAAARVEHIEQGWAQMRARGTEG